MCLFLSLFLAKPLFEDFPGRKRHQKCGACSHGKSEPGSTCRALAEVMTGNSPV